VTHPKEKTPKIFHFGSDPPPPEIIHNNPFHEQEPTTKKFHVLLN